MYIFLKHNPPIHNRSFVNSTFVNSTFFDSTWYSLSFPPTRVFITRTIAAVSLMAIVSSSETENAVFYFYMNNERNVDVLNLFCHLDASCPQLVTLHIISMLESYLRGGDDSVCELFIFLVPTSWLIAPPISSCHLYMVKSKKLTSLKPSCDQNVPTFKPEKWSTLLYNWNAI